MLRRTLAIGFSAALSACGGSTTAPASVPPPSTGPTPPVSTYILAGTLVATNGGQPLSGTVDVNGTAAQVVAGAFSATLPLSATGSLPVMIVGEMLVTRRIYLAGGMSRSVALDAIDRSAGFDLEFYRELVRNAYEAPTTLQSLRRWTRNPQIYMRTVDEAGAPIDAVTLDSTEQTLIATVPIWTSGRLSTSVVRGADTRIGQSGWITVRWNPSQTVGYCGISDIARDGGSIELEYKVGGGCRCANGPAIRPRTVRHELGHALGFFHTDSTADLMSGTGVSGCDAMPSARELYHARIAYQRPVGNTDPDNDPASVVNLAPMRVP